MKHQLFLALLLFSASCFAQDETENIAKLLGTTFDKPGAPVISQPIVVVEDYAIADWAQGSHGGRALLAKQDGKWRIVSCGGSGLARKDHLVSAGIPEQQAAALVSKLTAAETGLDKKQVHLFDSFKGERTH